MQIVNNVSNTALLFEGGGMRASYTSGILNVLLEAGLYFSYAAGVSAGSCHVVNYLSRDSKRAERSFVHLTLDPQFGGLMSLIRGKGYFRSEYIYGQVPFPGAALPFDFETFSANPAMLRIGAFCCNTGRMEYFGREDMKSLVDLAAIVRASSSLPIVMPPTRIGGQVYFDGGLGGGFALEAAKKDGFKRFFVVLTRPRGFRLRPFRFTKPARAYFRGWPGVVDALEARPGIYNRTLDELEEMEREGRAFPVYPDTMPVSSRETDFEKLSRSYRLGFEQGRRDLPRWKDFLGVQT